MLSRAEKSYSMFTEEDVEIKVSKELLLSLLQQVSRHLEVLKYEQGVTDDFAVQENISNTEMIMTKLFILMAEPYSRKVVILPLNIAEFLVFRECVHFNLQLTGMNDKNYGYLIRQIENKHSTLNEKDIREYRNFISNYKENRTALN